MEEELKMPNVHDDYAMFQACVCVRDSVNLLFAMFQGDTEYDKQYQKCFKQLKKVQKELDKAFDELSKRNKVSR